MKLMLISFVFSVVLFANPNRMAPPQQPNFPEIKSRMIENMDQRIAAETKTRNCMQAAKNHDELKKCHQIMRDESQKFHKVNQARMEKMREEWQKKHPQKK